MKGASISPDLEKMEAGFFFFSKPSRKMTAERQSKQPKIKQSGCKDDAVNLSTRAKRLI